MASSGKSKTRYRNWVFIVYPESAPKGWLDLLKEQLVPGYVSPLHDVDINPDGTPKKPHYHVILTFHSVHTYEQVKSITDLFNSPRPERVKDLRAQARYLCHLDNPEKAQYPISGVVCLCGADYLEITKSAADTDSAVAEMMDWCMQQGCYSFYRLSNYARDQRSDWFRVLTTSRTVFITNWLKSMKWEVDQEQAAAMRASWARDRKGEDYDTPPCDQ